MTPSVRLLNIARAVSGVAFAGGLITVLGVTVAGAPVSWLPLLLVPAIPILVAGQVLAIWEITAASGRTVFGARSGRRGRLTFSEMFGPSRPARNWGAALLVMVWLIAVTSLIIDQASGQAVGSGVPCTYPQNDHGTLTCVSAAQAASLQRFAVAVVTGFFGFHALAFDGGLARRTRADGERG